MFKGKVKSASGIFCVTKTGKLVKVIVSGYPQLGYCSKAYGLTFASVGDPISYVMSAASIPATYEATMQGSIVTRKSYSTNKVVKLV